MTVMNHRLLNLPLFTLIFLFGIQLQNLRVWAQELEPNQTDLVETPAEEKSENEEGENEDGFVIVEPSYIIPSDLTGNYYLVPYRARRTDWGFTVSVGYSTFKPDSYVPEYSADENYGSVYDKAETPLIEIQIATKYNMSLGSFVLEAAAGTFVEKSDNDDVKSQLSLTPVRIGLGYVLDTLFLEPYVSPYFSVGAYSILYKEKLAGASKNGTTQAAPYATAGLQFQLDWIDKVAARESYEDSGIESTFIFVEGRKFFASAYKADPDFETGIHLDAGLRVEF